MSGGLKHTRGESGQVLPLRFPGDLEERDGQSESQREEAEVQPRVLFKLPGMSIAGHSPAMMMCRKQMVESIL